MRDLNQILPARGGGRGTMRSMVSGALYTRYTQPHSPSTTGSAGGPPPRAEEDL